MGSIDRRRFIVAGGTFFAAPAVCLAQQARQRVAILSLGTAVTSTALVRVLAEGLRELGHVEGRDLEIDVRFAEGSEAALARLARELSARRPSVFIAPGTVVVDAVRKLRREFRW